MDEKKEIWSQDNFLIQLDQVPLNRALVLDQKETIGSGLKVMLDKNIGSLLLKKDGKISGIITERDFLYKLHISDQAQRELPLSSLMTPNPLCLPLTSNLKEVILTVVENEFRHLPLLKTEQVKDKLIGEEGPCIISVRDILRTIIKQFPNSIKKYGTVTSSKMAIFNAHDEAFNNEILESRGQSLSGAIFGLPIMRLQLRTPVIVEPQDEISLVLKKLIEGKTEVAMVVEFATKLRGIVTERDFLLKVFAQSSNSNIEKLKVSEIMTSTPHTLLPRHALANALNNMDKFNYRHVILVDEEHFPLGAVSMLEILGFIKRQVFP